MRVQVDTCGHNQTLQVWLCSIEAELSVRQCKQNRSNLHQGLLRTGNALLVVGGGGLSPGKASDYKSGSLYRSPDYKM